MLTLDDTFGEDGDRYPTMPLSRHSTTHIELIRQFLDLNARVSPQDSGNCLIEPT